MILLGFLSVTGDDYNLFWDILATVYVYFTDWLIVQNQMNCYTHLFCVKIELHSALQTGEGPEGLTLNFRNYL